MSSDGPVESHGLFGQYQQEHRGVVGHFPDVRIGEVGHDDPIFRGRLHIDRVQPNAVAHDCLLLGRPGEHLARKDTLGMQHNVSLAQGPQEFFRYRTRSSQDEPYIRLISEYLLLFEKMGARLGAGANDALFHAPLPLPTWIVYHSSSKSRSDRV